MLSLKAPGENLSLTLSSSWQLPVIVGVSWLKLFNLLFKPNFSYLLSEDKSREGFLSFGTIDIMGWIILYCHLL